LAFIRLSFAHRIHKQLTNQHRKNIMSDAIHEAVTTKLAELQIAYTATYVGQVTKPADGPEGKPWECDQWRVTFRREGHIAASVLREFSTDYFTGLGHRVYPKGWWPHFDKTLTRNTLAWHEQEKRKKPVAPDAAGVLHSLCMDAQAANESFSDWCDNYGYSSDSITALNTYQACEKIGREMRAFFGSDVARQLAKLVQDY
jgi:hypothetical protein